MHIKKEKNIYLAALLYIAWVISFSLVNYYQAKIELLSTLDEQLKSAALAIPYILPDGFHHKDMSKESVSGEEDRLLLAKLHDYAQKSNIYYLYSMIMQNGKIYFSSASATEQDLIDNGGKGFYFYHYYDADPIIYKVFDKRQIVYHNVSDRWGSFRSIFIPLQADDGTSYVVGADIPLGQISSLLRKEVLKTLVISLLFLLFAYPFFKVFTSQSKQWAAELEKRVEQRTSDLSQSENRLRLALNVANQGWFDLNLKTDELSVSDEYPKLLGYDPSEFHPSMQEWKQNIHPDDKEAVLDSFQECIESREVREIEYRRRTKDGDWLWLHSIGEVIAWDNNNAPIRMIGIHTNISKRKQLQQELEMMAHYDVLTNLPNRSLLSDRFSQAIAHSQRNQSLLGICFLDLDDFKPINDKYGHKTGDQILIEVAKRIKETIREEDTVSRQGGDEFILLLGNFDSSFQCELMLERIHYSLSQPYFIDDLTLNLSASSGATIYPLDDADLDTLMRHADQAMYQAKSAGKNCYRFFNRSENTSA